MGNKKLPDVGILVNIVRLEEKGNSLIMNYSFRPYMRWIFLTVSVLVSSLFFAMQASYGIFILIVCLAFTYLLQVRLFDRGQIEFTPREIICKRGLLMPTFTVLRRHYNSDLHTEARIEHGRSEYGTVENYFAEISDSYSTFTVCCPTREQSLIFVKILRGCELITKMD